MRTEEDNSTESREQIDEDVDHVETPEEIALRISIVLDTIVKYLDLKDLKAFRMVNSILNKVASKWMLKRSNNHLQAPMYFQSNAKLKKYCLCYSNHNDAPGFEYYYPCKSLEDLVKCLRTSTTNNFPCSSFGFIGGKLTEPDIEEFFTLHGSKVTTLFLHNGPKNLESQVHVSTLNKILSEKLPNIEALEIDSFLNGEEYTGGTLIDMYNLKSLTCLNVLTYHSSAFSMIGKCPRLQTIYNFKSHYALRFLKGLDGKKDMQRVKAIKKFEFTMDVMLHTNVLGDMDDVLQNWTYFSQTEPKLEHLIIPFNKHMAMQDVKLKLKFSQILNCLIESSQDSLTTLDVDTFNIFPYIHLPQLKNVKTLRFLSDIRENKIPELLQIFPQGQGIDLVHVFPKVEYVFCEFIGDRELVKKYFPAYSFTGTLPLVHTLEVVLPTSFELLKELMPNVKKVILNSLQSIQSDIAFLYLMYPNLEEIQIKCQRSLSLTDSELTGIPESDCQTLVEQTEGLDNFYDTYKKDTSIADFKKLKLLTISISNDALEEELAYEMKLPTHISGRVFRLNPNLKVIISYYHRCPSSPILAKALESIAPYVELVNEHYKQEMRLYQVLLSLRPEN